MWCVGLRILARNDVETLKIRVFCSALVPIWHTLIWQVLALDWHVLVLSSTVFPSRSDAMTEILIEGISQNEIPLILRSNIVTAPNDDL